MICRIRTAAAKFPLPRGHHAGCRCSVVPLPSRCALGRGRVLPPSAPVCLIALQAVPDGTKNGHVLVRDGKHPVKGEEGASTCNGASRPGGRLCIWSPPSPAHRSLPPLSDR